MVITICDSCTFAQKMGEAADQLKKLGHKVFTPEPLVTEEWYRQNHGRDKLLEMKPIWTQNHFKKIQISDAILILNHEKKGIKGYFGSNTLMELSVAFFTGKKIFLLHPIDESHPHFEELAGLETIVLNGSLENIRWAGNDS
jgi:hypothetical protein